MCVSREKVDHLNPRPVLWFRWLHLSVKWFVDFTPPMERVSSYHLSRDLPCFIFTHNSPYDHHKVTLLFTVSDHLKYSQLPDDFDPVNKHFSLVTGS